MTVNVKNLGQSDVLSVPKWPTDAAVVTNIANNFLNAFFCTVHISAYRFIVFFVQNE